MNVAIAVNGEGFGHASRMICLARTLQSSHRVVIWAPSSILMHMKHSLPGARFYYLPSLRLVKRDHRIRPLATLIRNLPLLWRMFRFVDRIAQQLADEHIDGVISDYEPFASRAAIRTGVPAVTYCHQAVLDRQDRRRLRGSIARLLNRFMMPKGVLQQVSSSFFDGDTGPLIRNEICEAARTDRAAIVVYASESIRDAIVPALDRIPGPVRIFPDSRMDFISELAAARAVIAPAGHQFLSEALSLGKPVLTFPQSGQYEQELNAEMAERSGYAIRGDVTRAAEEIERFLALIDQFPLHDPDPDVQFVLRDDTDCAADLLLRILQRPRWNETESPNERESMSHSERNAGLPA